MRPEHDENYNHEDDESFKEQDSPDIPETGTKIVCPCGKKFDVDDGFPSVFNDAVMICPDCAEDEMMQGDNW